MKTKYLSLLAAVCVCAAWIGCASQKTAKHVTTIPAMSVRISGDGASALPRPGDTLTGAPILGDEPTRGWMFYREGAFTEEGVKVLQERLAEQERRALEMAEYAGGRSCG